MANRINNKNSNKWHALDVQEVLKRLGASENGLSSDEALRRLEKVGPNSLVVEEGINPFRLLIRQVHNPLIYLLIFAAILSIFIGHTIDVIVIAGVIILNTMLGFFSGVACREGIVCSSPYGFSSCKGLERWQSKVNRCL